MLSAVKSSVHTFVWTINKKGNGQYIIYTTGFHFKPIIMLKTPSINNVSIKFLMDKLCLWI